MDNEILPSDNAAEARKAAADAFDLLARERAKIEARVAAYEKDQFDGVFESPNPIGVQVACEAISDFMSEETAEALKAESAALDKINDRFDAVEDKLEAQIATLSERREELVHEHHDKRKAANRGNVTTGFWPLYGGILMCVIAVVLTRDLGFGLPGAVVAGALGYASGSYIFKYFANRFVKPKAVVDENVEAELNALREEYDQIAETVNGLKDQLDLIERAEEAIDEIQMFIADTLDDLDKDSWDDEDEDDD